MNNLINLAIAEAHNPNSPMDPETRKAWLRLEIKRNALLEKLDKFDGYKTGLANCSQTI